MHKALALLSSFALALALTGCGGSPQTNPVERVEEESAEQVEEEPAAQVNRGALKIAIDEADATDWERYTDESGQGLRTALAHARTVLGKVAASQGEIEESMQMLDAAKAALVDYPQANKDELRALVEQAAGIDSSDGYEIHTWRTMHDAYLTARAVLSNVRASQEEVDAAALEMGRGLEVLAPEGSAVIVDENGRAVSKSEIFEQIEAAKQRIAEEGGL